MRLFISRNCSPVLVLVLCSLIAMYQLQAYADPGESEKVENVREVLEMILEASKSNLSEIRTMQGTYSILDRTYHQPPTEAPAGIGKREGAEEYQKKLDKLGGRPYWKIVDAEADFVVDMNAEKLYSDYREMGIRQTFVDSGKEIPHEQSLQEYRHVMTPREFYEHKMKDHSPRVSVDSLSYFKNKNGFRVRPKPGGLILISPTEFAQGNSVLGKVVDPNALWGSGSRRFDKTCELYLSSLKGLRSEREQEFATKNMEIWKTETETGANYRLVVYRNRPDQNRADFYTEMTFSSQYKFKATFSKIVLQGKLYEKREFIYDETKPGDKLIPNRIKIEFHGFNLRPGGVPYAIREFTLQNCEFNTPIKTKVFTLSDFDLEPGDFIDNQTEGKAYFVNDSLELKPLSEFSR